MALALAVNAALPVAVAGEDTSGAIHIQAQSLASALSQWVNRETALQAAANPDLVAGKQAPAVNGKLRRRAEALAQLLQGSGLSYALDGDAVTLRERRSAMPRQPAAPELAPLDVKVVGDWLGDANQAVVQNHPGARTVQAPRSKWSNKGDECARCAQGHPRRSSAGFQRHRRQ